MTVTRIVSLLCWTCPEISNSYPVNCNAWFLSLSLYDHWRHFIWISNIFMKFKARGWLNNWLECWDTSGGQETMFNLTWLFVKSFLGGTYNKTILKESMQNSQGQIWNTSVLQDAKELPGDPFPWNFFASGLKPSFWACHTDFTGVGVTLSISRPHKR